MSELENMTLLELRNFAKEQNIKNISKLKKEELVMLLNQVAETSKCIPTEDILSLINTYHDYCTDTMSTQFSNRKNNSVFIYPF